jgi:bifunctional DNA-binding transcriptional regulator/antitoxin component of YhaV-PrlF toxin-antitoxin module
MEEKKTSWTLDVIEVDDDLVLQLPQELLDMQGWKEGDVLIWIDNHDGSWTLTKKQDTVEDQCNLELDIKSDLAIVEKCRRSERYCQHLYAALCNNSFAKESFIPKLAGKNKWSCSWRYAGGLIADIRCEGDYMDWYCSGISDKVDSAGEYDDGTVIEGFITEEIKNDLRRLGWKPVDDSNTED